MSAAATAKETGTTTETNLDAMCGLVSAEFPERTGYKRKIIHLWNNFFRVNFHELDGNGIESDFVEVSGKKVITY